MPNQQQIPIPDTKPKYKSLTFWLPIVTPFLNFALIIFAAKYPGISEAIKKSGLDSAVIALIGGASLTSAASIFGEKHKDGKVLAAMVTNQTSTAILPVVAGTTIVPEIINDIKNVVDDVNDDIHYNDNENAG